MASHTSPEAPVENFVEKDPFETETESEFEGVFEESDFEDVEDDKTSDKILPLGVPQASSTWKKRTTISKRAGVFFPCARISRKLKKASTQRVQTSE